MNRCEPLVLTTALNTLALSLSGVLNDEELNLMAAALVQLGDTMATIAAQRAVAAAQDKAPV
ncbi:MAG: hypothetical protein RRY97_10005 [Oscillibacter sp.]